MANYLPKQYRDSFARWLALVGPDEWHQVADQWNWDNGSDPLRWIVEQPNCDRATALLIFWRGEPSYFWDGPATRNEWLASGRHFSADNYDLAVLIVDRWCGQGYARRKLAYDPMGDGFASRSDVDASRRHLALTLPQEMLTPCLGRSPRTETLDEGVPISLYG